MEVGVIAPMRCHKMINDSKLLIFSTGSCDFGIEDFFRTRCGECGECGQPAGRLAGWWVGRATPRGDPPGGAETTETTETTTETTTTNIPTPTTPLAPAPRDEISRSRHQPPHSDYILQKELAYTPLV